MKRMFAIFLVLSSSCLAQTFVSSAVFEDVSGAAFGSVNVVFNGGVAAGNAVACYIHHSTSGNSGLTLAVTGTGGDIFARAGTNAEATPNSWSALYLKSNSAGGSPYTATFTFSPAGYAGYIGVVCAQYSSVSPTSALDQTAQGVNNTSTGTYPYNSCRTATFTTTSPTEIIVLGGSGGSPYAATGFTLRGTSGGSAIVALLDKNVTSIQTPGAVTVTGAPFLDWNCNLATLVQGTPATPPVSAVRHRSTIY
jgi:hypothetical protein